MLGTILIATGAVLIAVFGVVPDGNHTLDELLALWSRGAFLAFFTIICLATAFVLAAAHVTVWRVKSSDRVRLPETEYSPSNYASPRAEPSIPFRPTSALHRPSDPDAVSNISAIHPIDTKTVRFLPVEEDFMAPLANDQQRTLTLCGLAFAAASGTLSGLCLVLAKSSIELVIATIDHWTNGRGQNEFTRIETWFLVAGLALAAVLQLIYLNYSLAFASPALICPLAFCFFNMASIFDGLIFYDQFGRLATYKIVLMSVGVAILLVGVWVVSAIQPTGDGGIEVGTWVEEESLDDTSTHDVLDELEAGEGATLLGGDSVSEPQEMDTAIAPDSPARGRSESPLSPQGPSPSSPVTRRRRPRYGTFIPEVATRPTMPAGFAFGIGAASPGFALRSTSHSNHFGRRNTFSHSRTNSLNSFPSRRRSEEDVTAVDGSTPGRGAYTRLPHSSRPRPRPLSLPTGPVPAEIASAPPRDRNVEQSLAEWDAQPLTPASAGPSTHGQEQNAWFRWPRLWRRGDIKLP